MRPIYKYSFFKKNVVYDSFLYLRRFSRIVYNFMFRNNNDCHSLLLKDSRTMKIYLVKLHRLSTGSSISLHVDGTSGIKACKYALRQVGKDWLVDYYKICKCPFLIYREYNGVRIWEDQALALFPGASVAIKLCSSDFQSMKEELKEMMRVL